MNDTPATQPETTASPSSMMEVPGGPIPDPVPAPAVPGAVEQGTPPVPGEEGTPQAPAAAPLALTDLTIPEGLQLSEDLSTKFLDAFNNSELDAKGRAQALLDLHTQVLKETAEGYAGQWEAMQTEWRTQVQKDFPGEKLLQAQSQIAKVLDRYGDKAVREAFALTGAGNHPAVFAFFTRIAQDMNEQPPVRGAPASSTPADRASRIYGSKE